MTTFLTPVALDFVWESLDAGELPYPLAARSHGETVDHRGLLRRQTFEALRDQHLMDTRGRLSPEIEDWLMLLARGTHSVDAVFEGRTALAAGDGHRALLATQTDEGLTLTRIDPTSVVSSTVALLPPCHRGAEKSITIPAADLTALAQGRAAGGTAADRQVLKALSEQPKLRAGQLAVNTRTPMGTRRRSQVVSWFDTPSGRYLTYTSTGRDCTDWVTIAPADPATLRHHLGELLTRLTAGR
ncbi:ESX secretion-associated protein EspG [Actinophytocola sp. NPDC049390]|uniref:ESX secretion-associated protein EspG n=1 Tax=Actinophytocola sp. NPDC049390 TaxID=3363894 RepID=UPI0037B01AE1